MPKFVITMTVINDGVPKEEFYTYDSNSGYPYWSNYLPSAEFFNSETDARNIINGSEFRKPNKMADGTVYPPRMIHSGLGLCNTKTSASGVLAIKEVSLTTLHQETIKTDLIISTDARARALNKLNAEDRAALGLN